MQDLFVKESVTNLTGFFSHQKERPHGLVLAKVDLLQHTLYGLGIVRGVKVVAKVKVTELDLEAMGKERVLKLGQY